MARVVLDASVIVSAPFGGDSATALVEIMEGHVLYLSTPIIQELKSLTRRVGEKVGRRRAIRFAQIVRQLLRKGKVVRIRRRIGICRDPTDNKYLETALAARATMIVSRDKDLLALTDEQMRKAGIQRVEILSPSAFLRRVRLH